MADTVKAMSPDTQLNFNFNQPIRGTARAGYPNTDVQSNFRNPSVSDIGGIDFALGSDYDPAFPMRGFEVHGTQSETIVMVEFMDGSKGRYDNITIVAGAGWVEVTGKWIRKILKETTATGVYPLF